MPIAAFSNIIPVIMTEHIAPPPTPTVIAPDSGSRWGAPSQFQFNIPQNPQANTPPSPQGGNGEVWDDDKYVTVIQLESLWSPSSTGGGGTWNDPFGINRGFGVFERKGTTKIAGTSCGPDDKAITICLEGTVNIPGSPTPQGYTSPPTYLFWDVQTTLEFSDVDMGDETWNVPTGMMSTGQQIYQTYTVHRKLNISFNKEEFGASSAEGLTDIPDLPLDCRDCR